MSNYQYAVEKSESPALVVDAKLRVLHANAGAHALLDYPQGRLEGVTMGSLLQARRQAELRNFEQLLSGGGARRWRTVLQGYDGRRRDVAISLSACLDREGQVEAVHVRFEESVRPSSSPPKMSGVHASVHQSQAARTERPSGRPTHAPPEASARTTPPPGMAVRGQLVHVTLEEARRRLVDIEARAQPATEPLPSDARAEVAKAAREALALLDEAMGLLSDDD